MDLITSGNGRYCTHLRVLSVSHRGTYHDSIGTERYYDLKLILFKILRQFDHAKQLLKVAYQFLQGMLCFVTIDLLSDGGILHVNSVSRRLKLIVFPGD